MAKKGNKYKGYEPGEAYDPTGVSKYLGLGRPIDFGQKVNKLAMMATIFLCVAITLWKTSGGMDSGEAVMFSLTSGLGFLLSYMIAQELDPDRQLGGIIGGALTVIGYYFFGAGNIIVLLWLLFVLRMLNRLCCGITLIIIAVTLIVAGGSLTSHLVRFRKLFPRLPMKRGHGKI